LIRVYTFDFSIKGSERMSELLKQFIKECNKRNHISLLLPEKGMYVKILIGESQYGFFISKEAITLELSEESHTIVQIECNLQTAIAWLSGKVKLRELINQKTMKVKGSFRDVLRLESIVMLAKPY
jgi:hypothetical protein